MDDDFFTTHPAVAKRKVDDPSLDSLNQRGDKRRRLNYLPNGSLFEIITMPTATAVKVALGKISPEVTNTVAGNSKQDLHVAGNASRSDKAIDDVILKASTSGFVKGHYTNDSLPSIKRLPRPILRPKAAKGKKPSKLSTKADVARVSSGEMGTKETSTETNGGVNETQKAFKPEADGVSRNSGGDEDPDATLVDPAYDETFLPVAHAIIKRKRDRKEHNDEASVRCSKKAKHFDVEEVSMKQRIKELKEWKADNINTIRDNNELLAEMTMDLVGRLMASEHRYASLEKKISRLEDELSLVGSQNFISSDGRTRIILSSKPANSTRTQHDSQESSSTPQSPTTTSSKVKGYDLIKDNPSFIPGLANPKHTPAPEWLMGEEPQRKRWSPSSMDPDNDAETSDSQGAGIKNVKRGAKTSPKLKQAANASNKARNPSREERFEEDGQMQEPDVPSNGAEQTVSPQKKARGNGKKASIGLD